ncbi:hypothetical protein CGI46_00470 [Vibrio parahaemolyticus]|nr:hypothetical protein CGK30_09620 [Vibrio parahaemolyticus]TOJ13553.1 hypothetical protein CGI46_00470 [Vibrio parahaemolyticus]
MKYMPLLSFVILFVNKPLYTILNRVLHAKQQYENRLT